MVDRFGPYVLLSELGRGAAGIVYRARHADLDRTVALKVLHSANPQMAERFHREALAAARLRHPNIVTVHDAGQVDGVPYLAMELVEGAPFDLGRFPLRKRIEILAKVADAVHHAHSNGIVHRDLKPANILLDASHGPRLVDFGLARLASEATRLTRTGTALGTPLYMSPEQVRGAHNVGPLSDVYSLGVLLYEALAGRTPFHGHSVEQIYPKILSADPPPLTGVPADLATIAFKALEKNPIRRYGSALTLADDLRRWLNDQPILARPPSVAYRLQKLIVRRKGVLAGSSAAFLLAGAVAAFLLPRSAREARLRETREQELALERRAREAIELYLPLERDLDLLRMNFYKPDYRMTEDEFGRHEALIERIHRQMKSSGESAQGWYLIGRCRDVVAAGDEADEAYARAMTLDPRHARTLLARGKLNLERCLLKRSSNGDTAQGQAAVDESEQAVEWVRRGATSAGGKADAAMELELAEGYVDVLRNWGRTWDYPSAEQLERWAGRPLVEEFILLEGLAGRKLEASCDRILACAPSYPTAHFWKGNARSGRNDPAAAVADFTAALRINPRLARAYTNRARAHESLGQYDQAIADFTAAIKIVPGNGEFRRGRGNLFVGQGRFEEAAEDFTEAIRINPRNAEALFSRGNALRSLGRPEEAIADYTAALEASPRYAEVYTNRGSTLQALGRRDEALVDFAMAIEIDPQHETAFFNRGNAHRTEGRFEEAVADYTAAIRIRPRYAEAFYNRGLARKAQGRPEQAAADYRKALELAPPDWPWRAKVQAAIDKMER